MRRRIKPEPVPGARVLLDRRQACAAIGCDPRTLAKLIDAGTIREITLGGLRRIPASELDRLVDEPQPPAAA